MLPDGFLWRSILAGDPDRRAVFVGTVEVARITERVDGRGWHVMVDRQRFDWQDRGSSIAPDEATARRWIGVWAYRDQARIREEVAAYNGRLAGWAQR